MPEVQSWCLWRSCSVIQAMQPSVLDSTFSLNILIHETEIYAAAKMITWKCSFLMCLSHLKCVCGPNDGTDCSNSTELAENAGEELCGLFSS